MGDQHQGAIAPGLGQQQLAFRTFLGRLLQSLQQHLAGQSDRGHVPLPAMPGEAAGWMARDGFHPGLLGYQAWVEALTRQMLLEGAAALQPAEAA